MMNFLTLLLACTWPAGAHFNIDLSPEFDDSYTAEIEPYSDRGLKVSYLSSIAIEVYNGGFAAGSGSGNYFKLGKKRFILTAAHVVSDAEEIIVLEKGFSRTVAKVVYLNKDTDIAVLVPEERLRHTKAIPFRRDINNQMGEKTYHCGHPAREGWHISEGLLTGTQNDVLMINTFAWPGSSGSVLFDESGRVLGILSAIRVDAPFGLPALVEHITLASNIKMLDQETLKAALRNGK
jgi:S1-C subfamily serine protease